MFVKGFLKSFADAIGADSDETLRRFHARRGVQSASIAQAHKGIRRKGSSWLTLLWISLLMIALVGATLLAYGLLHQPDGDKTARPDDSTGTEVLSEERGMSFDLSANERPPAAADAGQDAASDAAIEQVTSDDNQKGPENTSSTQVPSSYLLEIVCDEDTWLKVIADDAPAAEHFLKPGDTLRLTADTKFNLLIGNAGGVSVQFNGKPVPVPGGSGEVVNLELP